MDILKEIMVILVGGSGTLALFYTAYQAATRRRAHKLELYRQSFSMMDAGELRNARRFVYKIDRELYQKEKWLDLADYKTDPDYSNWESNQTKAEMVARSFDQLGLLVREGLLPINIVATFYASPAIRCWYSLSPYINEMRSPKYKNQPGHMWEWENLVCNIIIPFLQEGKGIWAGVSKHDMLEDFAARISHERETMIRDKEYSPVTNVWEMGAFYEIWKW